MQKELQIRTIPELYTYLINKYGKMHNRFSMSSKTGDKYQGITYAEMHENTEKFAYGLAALGVQKDDKVAIISENRPEWVYSDFAILQLGAVDVPMYPSLTADSIEFILNNSESKAIIISNKFQLNKILKILDKCKYLKYLIILNDKDQVEDVPILHSFKDVQLMGEIYKPHHPNLLKDSISKIKEDDLCTIIYTSGTTGEPKGVMLSHKNILSNVKAALQIFPINESDTFLSFLPLCHIFERMAGYYTAFSAGSTVYFAQSIETVSQNLIEVKPTLMTTVPRLFERIHSKILKTVENESTVKQKIFYGAINTGKNYAAAKKKNKVSPLLYAKYKLSKKLVFDKLREKTGGRLRFFISGGAALSKELGEFFEAIGLIIIEGYGLTEASPVIAANVFDDYNFGTVGKAMPGVEIKIADDGEILAKGPNIMQGYYKNKKETDAVIKNGWLHTGDIGIFNEQGFLVITDRKKHLFKTTGGKYIAPTPIENLFLTSKYIDQFMLIGDRRRFLTALIVPDIDAMKEYADRNKIVYHSVDDLVQNSEIYNLIEKELSKLQKGLSNYEKIRKFTILEKPFSIETGEITPSLKIKRKIVEEKYLDLIEKMYASL